MSDQIRGAYFGAAGTQFPATAGISAGTRVQHTHSRYLEATIKNRIFGFGISNTVLSANTAIATAVDATAKPVIAVWNPLSSGVFLNILKAWVFETTLANTSVATGGFMWLGSTGNTLSTGSTPMSFGTLVSGGSLAKAFAVSTALTGLTTSLSVLRPFNIAPHNAVGAATAASIVQSGGIDEVEGSFLVPPGGVLAVMNQLSTTTINVSSGIMWEEVPALS